MATVPAGHSIRLSCMLLCSLSANRWATTAWGTTTVSVIQYSLNPHWRLLTKIPTQQERDMPVSITAQARASPTFQRCLPYMMTATLWCWRWGILIWRSRATIILTSCYRRFQWPVSCQLTRVPAIIPCTMPLQHRYYMTRIQDGQRHNRWT